MSGTGRVGETSVDLANAYVSRDDQAAANRLYHRHRDATLQLAARGMSDRLQVRIDPEDVYQSVSLILFRGLKKGQFRLTRAGDLRALLAQLTYTRIQKKVDQNTAEKRHIGRESRLSTIEFSPAVQTQSDHTVEEQDEVDAFLTRLPNPKHQIVIRMALSGMAINEIATNCNCSNVRVRQILRNVAEQMLGTE